MSNFYLTCFIVCSIVFLIFKLINTKTSISSVFKGYFSNYFGGFLSVGDETHDSKRKFSIGSVMCLGVLPYLLGMFFCLAFFDVVLSFNIDIIIQVKSNKM